MTRTELFTLLNSIQGFTGKVAYFSFPENAAPSLPFICFFTPEADNFAADGKVYYSANRYQIELYTKNIDETSETAVEGALADRYYTKTQMYLEDEGVWETIYEIEV